ncbi:MAG: PorT family protein, partial [Bacteroidales bacterium]|nr:PorT family protein [Bacteroidales bacterium]
MKKVMLVLVAAMLATSAFAKVGVIGGVTFSPQNVSFKEVQQWHAGITWEIPIGAGFSFQPSAIYATKAGIQNGDKSGGFDVNTLSMGYVQVPVQFLWGPDLAKKNFKPYVFGEPYVGYNLVQDKTFAEVKNISDVGKMIDWGVGIGIGIKFFQHVQIMGRYVWSFGNILA